MQKPAKHKWTIAGDVLVAFSTGGVMSDDVWNAMIEDLATKPVIGYLGTSNGLVQVSSTQRKLGAETVKKRGIPAAIISEEKVVLGFVIAASWLGAKIKGFSWGEARHAVRWLGVRPENEQIVLETVMKLRSSS